MKTIDLSIELVPSGGLTIDVAIDGVVQSVTVGGGLVIPDHAWVSSAGGNYWVSSAGGNYWVSTV